jgi:hypothetical protein
MPRSTPFFGHPLTPRAEPLDREHREDAARRLEQSDNLNHDPDLLSYLTSMSGHLERMAHHLGRSAHRRILWSGTASLDNTGVWTKKAGDSIASGALWIFSPTVPVVVTTGARLGQPANFGAGVWQVPPGVELTLNAHAEQWTIYGAGPAPATPVTLEVPNPAAGSDWSYILPSQMAIQAITAQLTTSGVAATRQPQLFISDPFGNSIGRYESGTAEPAGTTDFYNWAPGFPVSGPLPDVYVPMPSLTLAAGSTITVHTGSSGIQAGDQWSAIGISGTQTGGSAAQSAGALVNVTMFSDPVQPSL